ncbi:MAG: PP2C family protein-serine/threonine phosphatase [Deltaproteobacteria bacterium]|nr:PP2C family protein-serine/threonine phosphatase [Deltaproteobacteria bacterium]
MPPEESSLDAYVNSIVHEWLMTLTALGFTLIPIFFILDYFMMPPELLSRFALYRLVTTAIVIGQYFFIRYTKPSSASLLHGYFFSLVAGGMIALMTTDLGGFNSTYYAGLNLVMIATNLLLPWAAIHSAINSVVIIGIYLLLNLARPSPEPPNDVVLLNNLYFMTGTAIISVSINWVKQKLIKQEFLSRRDLKAARDALWGEMEVAKQIQTSLLPKVRRVDRYEVAATMLPAAEVGGDYYDIIQTRAGETWLCVGDVSGHGVESGLIMMMTQTSIFTSVNSAPGLEPSKVLERVNDVIKENISRLGTDRYMTLSALVLRHDHLLCAGKHQDILVYRKARGRTECVPTTGTWIGIIDDLTGKMPDTRIDIGVGDVVLLYTDGVTEAMSAAGEMFGEERLERALSALAHLPVADIVRSLLAQVEAHMGEQHDDISLVVLKRTDRPSV